MPDNTFGELFRVTTFGESHGRAVGCVVDGCPAGVRWKPNIIDRMLERRRPAQSSIASPRKESDQWEVLSGVFEGYTLGTPIALVVYNTDARARHYETLKDKYRPSHADYTWEARFGRRDWRGGGRASARETVGRVLGGAVAMMLLEEAGISIQAYVSQVGEVVCPVSWEELDLSQVEATPVRCPHLPTAQQMLRAIKEAQISGETLGGIITCIVRGVPPGLGAPVFDKLEATLAHALMSIPAVKGFEVGLGFASARMTGSQYNDQWQWADNRLQTTTNHDGGIQGGISNGMDIYFRVAFKPISSIRKPQKMAVPATHSLQEMTVEGRHDPCPVPRAVPIVEAMTAIVLADQWLRLRVARL